MKKAQKASGRRVATFSRRAPVRPQYWGRFCDSRAHRSSKELAERAFSLRGSARLSGRGARLVAGRDRKLVGVRAEGQAGDGAPEVVAGQAAARAHVPHPHLVVQRPARQQVRLGGVEPHLRANFHSPRWRGGGGGGGAGGGQSM